MDNATFDRDALGYEAVRLLEALLERTEGSSRAQVSTSALLKASGLTQGALIRARNELTQQGLLRTEPGFSANGLRGANVYVLNCAALGGSSPALPEDEVEQNRTEGASVTLLPGVSVTNDDSEGQAQLRRGFFSRMFRRPRAS